MDARMWLVIGLPVGIVACGCLLFVIAIQSGRYRVRGRSTPLTSDLLRPPGHGLRERAEDLTFDMDYNFSMLLAIPLMVYGIMTGDAYWGLGKFHGVVLVSIWIAAVLFLLWLARDTHLKWQKRRNYYLGLDGELAVAEELNQLMLDGARVFHDVPSDYGNIDHVVVSKSGVYAIETKMIGKPRPKPGQSADAGLVVDHEAGLLRFPHRTIPLTKFEPQLQTAQRWLERKLSESTGSPVKVEPILALPGWHIAQRIGAGPIYVINPKRPQAFLVRNYDAHTPARIQALAHQLEQLCRNVEPIARRPATGGAS